MYIKSKGQRQEIFEKVFEKRMPRSQSSIICDKEKESLILFMVYILNSLIVKLNKVMILKNNSEKL